MPDFNIDETEQIGLCEVLDRVLNKGVVVKGEVTISVANVDLLYVGLNLMIGSVETARELMLPANQSEDRVSGKTRFTRLNESSGKAGDFNQ